MLQRHVPPLPELCEVCRFAIDAGVDVEREHALTRWATRMLLDELEERGGGPLTLRSVAVEAWDPGVGVVHRMEPRHWHWALYFEPRIGMVLRDTR